MADADARIRSALPDSHWLWRYILVLRLDPTIFIAGLINRLNNRKGRIATVDGFDMKIQSANTEKIIDYYNGLENILAGIRNAGEYGTHFGISESVNENYCFFRACTQAKDRPEDAKLLSDSMSNLHHRIFSPYQSPERVLDVGFGIGGTIYRLVKQWPSSLIYGVNINSFQFQKAKELLKNYRHCELELTDFLQMDESRQYDLIYFIESLFHMPQKPLVMEKLFRLLNANGEICIVDIFFDRKVAKRFARGGERSQAVFSYLSLDDWKNLLDRFGFEIAEFDDLSRLVLPSIQVQTTLHSLWEITKKQNGPQIPDELLREQVKQIYDGYVKLSKMINKTQAYYGILRVRKCR